MSCEVIALPYAIAFVIGKIVANNVLSDAASNKIDELYKKEYGTTYSDDYLQNAYNKEPEFMITDCHFIEKEYETPFTNKDILIKTLEEHGVQNIKDSHKEISGEVEGYILSFTQNDTQSPYLLKIKCPEEKSSDEKVEDLNSEYSMNVQEDVYLKILDKIKQNNMQLESEEVDEDNTITLTINLD